MISKCYLRCLITDAICATSQLFKQKPLVVLKQSGGNLEKEQLTMNCTVWRGTQ